MAVLIEDGRMRLSGTVGDFYYDDCFTASDVVVALGGINPDSDLTVHINSGGGIATEGAAIHALLSARPGTTNIVVEGIAASAASLIAMAGATVTMALGAVMMIHDPSGFTFGTSAEHGKSIEGLEALATSYARVYADKSGKTIEEARTVMKAERWLTPDEAVTEGFADAVNPGRAATVAAFDYRTYAHAPKRLVALAKAKGWSHAEAARHPAAASHRAPISAHTQKGGLFPQKETHMTEKATAEDSATAIARLKAELATMTAANEAHERRAAIMALPEAAGREAQAKVLVEAGVGVDAAKAVLAAAPVPGDPEEAGLPPAAAYEASRSTGAGLRGKSAPAAGAEAKAGWGTVAARMNARLA